MLTPTRPLLIGQFYSVWHPFFHFLSLFHFRSWVSPVLPFPSKSFSIGDVRQASLPLGPLCTVGDVDWEVVRGGRPPPPPHWRRPLSGSAKARRIGLAARGPASGSAQLLGFSVCVSYRGGVSSEWSPPASAAAASRGLPENRAGGESGCGLVLTVIVAFPCLGGLRPGLLLPRERAFTAIPHSLPGLSTHPGLVRVK